jgi:heptosyltransferase-1
MPEKILVVNMNYLGDALLTTPALFDLRRAFPKARIDTIVGAGAAETLRDNPHVDTVIARRGKAGWGRLAELYQLLRAGHYSMVIYLPPIPGYALMGWLARTPRRVGQSTRQMAPFLTDRRTVRAAHLADRMRETMPVPLPLAPAPRQLTMTLTPDAVQAAQALLSAWGIAPNALFLAVNVGATRPQKRWPALAFAQALDLLPGLPCVLLGAGDVDMSLAREILAHAYRPDIVNLVGQTDVPILAAVLAQSAVLLSADSGPMHIATAVDTPTVALFGSTAPDLTGPYDDRSHVLYAHLPCAPCFKSPICGGRWDCMRVLTPTDVSLAVRALLRGQKPTLALPMLPASGALPTAAGGPA